MSSSIQGCTATADAIIHDFQQLENEVDEDGIITFGSYRRPLVCLREYGFRLHVAPNGKKWSKDSQGWVSVGIMRLDEADTDDSDEDDDSEDLTPHIIAEVAALSIRGQCQTILQSVTIHKQWGPYQTWAHNQWLSRAIAMQEGKFIIRIVMQFKESGSVPRPITMHGMGAWANLSEWFPVDVTLQANAGHEVKVHRAVLSHASPVFKSMFESGMAEVQNSTVSFKEFRIDTVKELVDFIYRGILPDVAEGISEHVIEVMSAAKKYGIDSLVSYIEDSLVEQLTPETACGILLAATSTGARNLRVRTIEYMVADRDSFQSVHDSKDFETLDKDLVMEILTKFLGKREREDDSNEFPDGSDWKRFSAGQLRRACAERGLPDDGPRELLIAALCKD